MKNRASKHEGEEIVSYLQIESLQSLSAAAVYKHVELLLQYFYILYELVQWI